MRRFLLTLPPDSDGRVRLTGKDHRYLCRVLRLHQGDSFPASLPSGEEVRLRIRSIGSTSMEGQVLREEGIDGIQEPVGEPQPLPGRTVPPIILCQSLPKGQKMDIIVRQATEAGIERILPFVSEHSIPTVGTDAERIRKMERWDRIVKEARQQSGSSVASVVEKPTTTYGIIEFWKSFSLSHTRAVGILFHQDPLAQGTLHGYLSDCPEAVILVVGPEGGFSDSEASQFLDAGFKPILLGGTILRTETAALFAAAATHVILLESASWMPKPLIPQKSNGSPV
jgi:16S rRNA (uracil1498-N3)-methyltransferase